MDTLTNWAGGIALAALLLFGSGLDGIEDHSLERAHADDLEAAMRQADEDARREAAALQLCAEAGSINTVPVWLPDGSLDCRTRTGRRVGTFPLHLISAL